MTLTPALSLREREIVFSNNDFSRPTSLRLGGFFLDGISFRFRHPSHRRLAPEQNRQHRAGQLA